MIIKCTCKSDYQDATHGKGNRVFNPCKKESSGSQKYRCTVCQTVKTEKQ